MNRVQPDSYWYDAGYKSAKKETIDNVLEVIDTAQTYKMFEGQEDTYLDQRELRKAVLALRGEQE